jgi:protein-S-isoprenylcysteine O-methyltransferase Ste14
MPTGICVRHPRYTGLFFTRLSFALMLASPIAWCLCILWWLLIERRIRREERYLQAKFGSAYDLYAAKTPRLIPTLFT